MPKVLITGSGGQLGQELQVLAARFPAFTFLAPARTELDITQTAQLRAYFAEHQPDYCFNTAAYTAVDRAETEAEAAYACNETAVGQLAQLCAQYDCHLIHYSTDYVYRGGIGRPLREDDPTEPSGVYAASKLAGEQAALASGARATIVRTSWVYSSFGHNFVKTMLRLGRERNQLSIVFDQVGTPTYATDLALASLQVIQQIERGECPAARTQGIFHYSNEGVASWYDFALAIFELSGIECRVRPIRSEAYPTPATRPHYSVLDKEKFKASFGLDIPHWRASLKRCLKRLADANK
ncbi:MAG: dTDP-4-dehydrorhamnose reductase [Bacteroidetes bacterium]|nr:MAG: dTDP-4-dehydrorhamnose reductase [Bacteroidota bacterium]